MSCAPSWKCLNAWTPRNRIEWQGTGFCGSKVGSNSALEVRKKPTPGSVRTGKPHKVSLKVLADSLELSPATVSLKTRCEVLHNGLGSGKGKPHEIEYSLID